jgi:HTH-type transcriptional regulator/antitoxin HigA
MSTAKKLIDTLKEDVKRSQQKVEPTYLELVEVFPLQTISSKNQHGTALVIIEKLITFINDKQPDDKGIEIYLKTLTELVGDYETNQFTIGKVTGAEMLSYLMDLQGLNQSDLSKELGGQSVVSKILKGERDLNLRQVKALAKRFKVSPEVFI